MPSHQGVDHHYTAAGRTQANAQFRLLAGDQVGPVAADGAERGDAHQGVATARDGRPNRNVPLEVAQPVVDGQVRVPLSATAAGYDHIRSAVERSHGHIEPLRIDFAVAVHELDVLDAGS